MKDCDVILFDLDGTLLDTLEDMYDAVNRTLRAMGRKERTRDEVRAFVGNGARRLLELALGTKEEEEVERALSLYLPDYEAHCRDKSVPYAGILDAMRTLRAAGKKLAVVSNKPDEGVQALAALYFGDLVDYAVGERAGIARKPAPDTVLAALDALGASAETAVYVGDSEVDVMTAKAAGTKLLAVSWGFRSKQQLIDAGAEAIADSVGEMMEMLG